MNPIDKLTLKDKEMFQEYVIEYAMHDDCEAEGIPLESPIFPYWNSGKAELFKLFGNELIIKRDIEYAESIDQLMDRLEENDTFIAFFNDFKNALYHMYVNQIISYDFYDDMRTYVIELRNFAESIYRYDSKEYIDSVTNISIKCHKGQKIMKIVKELLNKLPQNANIKYLLDKYENMRIAHSQVLNTKKLTGTLCLSIHPMDFATMSDNNCNWQSCMSWWDKGGYRRGTLEMMTSPCVVVAYLCADEDMQATRAHKWNNKKWRELFVVGKSVIANICGYPYHQEGLETIVIEWLHELRMKNWEYEPLHGIYTYSNGKITLPDDASINFRFTTDAMYNDFRFTHQVMISDAIKNKDISFINYSGTAVCLKCGCEGWADESLLLCDGCDEIIYCTCCGDRISDDDLNYINGEYYCYDCFNDHYTTCSGCGKDCDTNDVVTFELYDKERLVYNGSFCPDCTADWDKHKDEYCTKYQFLDDWFEVGYQIDISNLTDAGYEFFGLKKNSAT